MRPAIICDMDGTLCDVAGVRHYVEGDRRRRNFDKFHAGAALCPANPTVLATVRAAAERGDVVMIVTARSERWRDATRTWLEKWDVPYDELLMRSYRDQRSDVEVKRDILAAIRSRGLVPYLAIDDRPEVIEMWKSEQILVMEVPGWTGGRR